MLINSPDNPTDQVCSPSYPDDFSWIKLDPTTAGSIDSLFTSAIQAHGNDIQFQWHSYAKGSADNFTVRLSGFSKADQEDTDGYQMHIWELEFHERQTTLIIDTGMSIVQRYEGEQLVDGSHKDVSDLIAAALNVRDYNEERRAQGWDPIIDEMLRDEGLL